MNHDKLKSIVPVKVWDELKSVATKFHINTPYRLAHFLAQCAHESCDFTRTTENLNYSAERLLEVFPKYFTEATAAAYARHPSAIASLVYANRMGNHNEASKMGWQFRGRGYLQITGRDCYAQFNTVVPEDILAQPDLVATKYPLLSAAWYWNTRNLNDLADQGDRALAVITRKINGGYNGFKDRKEKYARCCEVLL